MMRALTDRVSAIFARTIGGHAVPPPPSTRLDSNAIVVARVLCILGIVYAHAWTGRGGAWLLLNADTAQGMMRALFMETIGRSAVPLLGMISGWLVAGSALKRGYWRFVGGKARTILAPMLLWNALALSLLGFAMWMGWNYGPRINDLPRFIFEEMTSFSEMNKVNFQTPFLRDLFVLMLLAPVLIRLRSGWLALLTATVLAWSVWNWYFPLILRPQVALFFLIGILARRFGVAERIAGTRWRWLLPPFLVFAAIKFDFAVFDWYFAWEHKPVAMAVEIALRLSAAALLWRLCIALADRPSLALFRRIEPYAFFFFCAHMIFIWLFAQHVGKIVGPLGSPLYPLFFLPLPIYLLLGSIGLARLVMRLSPGWADILSGGRLKAPGRLTSSREAPIAPAS